MAWTDPVDIYCERVGPEFWAEPLNAVTNLAFIAAGLIAARQAQRLGRLDPLIAMLCLLAVALGIGSFLFHTVAERWAGLADVIPILLFIILFLYAAMTRFFGLQWPMAIFASAAAFGASLIAEDLALWIAGGPLNGSERYAPAFALLAGSSIVLAARRHAAWRGVGLASLIFALSLTFRTIDVGWCGINPIGTHFLWHLLNGTMIAILLLTLIRTGRA